MTRNLLRSVVFALALALLAACGGGSPAATDAGATPSSAQDSKPAADKPTEASEPTEAPEPTASSETRDITDISGSLDALKSYRLRFTFTFDGKDDQGKAQKGSMEFLQEIIRASKDQHMRYSATGDASQGGGQGVFEYYMVGGSTYIYSPDGQSEQKCIGMTSDQSSQSPGELFKPSDIVGGLRQAKLAGKGETVNGVKADHYTFDQSDVTFGTFATAKGDVWVAQDGGFMVKYVGTATGKGNMLAAKSGEGTFTWEYNVEDANKVEAIDLPKECAGQQPADDIPTPENATEKASFGKMLTFKSADAPADVAAFYKKALPAQGWQAGETNDLGEMQTLIFTKDSRKLTVTIMKEIASVSSVMINEEPAE